MASRGDDVRWAGLPYARMNGIGNAILVVDLRGRDLVLSADEVVAIDRLPGMGFDQLMAIHDPQAPDCQASLRIYNNDGSPSGACGNGTRCVAWFLRDLAGSGELVLGVGAARLVCRAAGPLRFSVDMGAPRLSWQEVPLREAVDPRALELGRTETGFALSMGNPHVVFFVPDVDAVALEAAGPPVETHPMFPERVNVSFAEVVARDRIKLRVWERGAGATLACGSGACATLVAAAATGRTDREAVVELPGGALTIAWRADDHVIMTGPVALEHEGRLAVAADATA